MKVIRNKRALRLRLQHPARVTTVIPTAKVLGPYDVVLPHRPDETRVLRNLGIDAPAPMPIHYEWPKVRGVHDPFGAQIVTATAASMHDRLFILNGMGTGKTNSVLWAVDYLQQCKSIRRTLVICPMSTMDRTWADSVFFTFGHMTSCVLYGSRERRRKLLSKPADVYIINVDGVATIAKDLEDRPDIDLIVVDELALARNAQTTRWKLLNAICNRQHTRKVWGLTGSPTPNAPTDAWAQCRLVTPDNAEVPKFFGRFKDMTMRQVGPFKWIPRPEATSVVAKCMQPSVRFSLEDCTDLPEQIVVERHAELTKEQKAAYDQMAAKLRADVDGGTVMAVNEAVKASKLLQIATGCLYEGDDTHVLPAGPRVDVVKELIEESEGKVIVFVPFTGSLRNLAVELSKDHAVEVVEGATSKAERDRVFSAFQDQSEPRVLVANPQAMSHGLTLTAATTVVWYAPTWYPETYEQACARVRRPGQTKKTVIAHIAGTPAERKIYKRLEAKQSMQGALLDMIREQE